MWADIQKKFNDIQLEDYPKIDESYNHESDQTNCISELPFISNVETFFNCETV
jgi:hypothetical protein